MPKATNHEGPDRSKADFNFCLLSIARGFLVDEVVQQLMKRSEKAREKGFGYASLTAKNAVEVTDRRRSRSLM